MRSLGPMERGVLGGGAPRAAVTPSGLSYPRSSLLPHPPAPMGLQSGCWAVPSGICPLGSCSKALQGHLSLGSTVGPQGKGHFPASLLFISVGCCRAGKGRDSKALPLFSSVLVCNKAM